MTTPDRASDHLVHPQAMRTPSPETKLHALLTTEDGRECVEGVPVSATVTRSAAEALRTDSHLVLTVPPRDFVSPLAAMTDTKMTDMNKSDNNKTTASSTTTGPLSFVHTLPSLGVHLDHRWVRNPASGEYEFLVPRSTNSTSNSAPDLSNASESPVSSYHHPAYRPVRFDDVERAVMENGCGGGELCGLWQLVCFLGIDARKHIHNTAAFAHAAAQPKSASDDARHHYKHNLQATQYSPADTHPLNNNNNNHCHHLSDTVEMKCYEEIVKRILRRLAEEAGVMTVSDRYKSFEQKALRLSGGFDCTM